MPEKSDHHKRTHPIKRFGDTHQTTPRPRRSRRQPYAELHCKSNFSFLRGASHPEELAERAARLGYSALAITDRNTLAGAVRTHCAAKACDLKLIVGAEITPTDALAIILYAPDRASYGQLARVITQGCLRTKKGSCEVTLEDIAQRSKGLIAAVPYPASPDRNDPTEIESDLNSYHDIFGDRLYLSASIHGGADDNRRLARIDALARAAGIPMIATNDVHYHEPKRRFLQDVLTCIRRRCTLHEAGTSLFANAERHLKPIDEMKRLFVDYPSAIARTVEIADRCTFSLDELRYEYPEALCPPDRTPAEYLAELTWTGARERYPSGIPHNIRNLIEHELTLISELAYEPYFLTVWDIVRFARARDILCQGRGSAANSVVCYCLGITSVDPDRVETLFERFVSAERNEPPDIDVDFEHERREEVFQYIYNKYGRDHAGIAAEVITYRPRSAIRDVGKALGLSLDRVDALAKKHEWWDRTLLSSEFLRETGIDPNDRTIRLLAKLVAQIVGFPRHLSQHVGGFVITRGPLCEMVPIENGAMPNRTFIEWDKDDIDALGILKIDCLALGMLTAIHKCFKLIERSPDHLASDAPSPLALHTIPEEDPSVYDMICRADTIGVFQIESRAQMSMLPRLKPRNYYDLVIEVAIVRPGPIQGGMVHPYLRRRAGEEAIHYPNRQIREVLKRTLGVPLFQEQAMRLAIVAAGFTPGEADQLRRAMGAWRRNGDITRFRDKLIDGMTKTGLSEEFAQRCFQQICGFGEYGFPESHAASFALLVYVSAWLKRYHPAAFCASLLNAQPMGFYQPAQLVRDAKEHGVTILPVDVNFSGYDCRLDDSRRPGFATESNYATPNTDPSRWGESGPAIRLGMRLVRGISRVQVEGIERAQREGRSCGGRHFTCVADIARRSGASLSAGTSLSAGASRGTLARLAAADAMQSLGLTRREAVWQVLALSDDPPLLEGHEAPAESEALAESEGDESAPNLPAMSLRDVVLADYDTIGLSLNAHPMSLIREELSRLDVQPNRVLKTARQGRRMKVSGIVLVRQRPSTASGITFCTIEDETGVANLIIRPAIYEKCRRSARGAAALIVTGTVERQGEVVHIQVSRIEEVSSGLNGLRGSSRDFH